MLNMRPQRHPAAPSTPSSKTNDFLGRRIIFEGVVAAASWRLVGFRGSATEVAFGMLIVAVLWRGTLPSCSYGRVGTVAFLH
jgi:hypothetical protein